MQRRIGCGRDRAYELRHLLPPGVVVKIGERYYAVPEKLDEALANGLPTKREDPRPAA
jgi:hypothetical protein